MIGGSCPVCLGFTVLRGVGPCPHCRSAEDVEFVQAVIGERRPNVSDAPGSVA